MRYVGALTDDGLLVGYASVQAGTNNSTWLRPGRAKLTVYVYEPWRERGVGRPLYRVVEQGALDHGATTLEAGVEEADVAGLAFAERRGFAKERRLFASTLDLATFDTAPFAGVVAAAEVAGLRFTSYAAYPRDDASLARFRDL